MHKLQQVISSINSFKNCTESIPSRCNTSVTNVDKQQTTLCFWNNDSFILRFRILSNHQLVSGTKTQSFTGMKVMFQPKLPGRAVNFEDENITSCGVFNCHFPRFWPCNLPFSLWRKGIFKLLSPEVKPNYRINSTVLSLLFISGKK